MNTTEEMMEMEVPTLMDKSVKIVPNEDAVRTAKNRSLELLDEYQYNPSEYGINKIYSGNISAKGWMYALWRKSPYYNGNGQIVLPDQSMFRGIDAKAIDAFFNWMFIYNTTIDFSNAMDAVRIVLKATTSGIIGAEEIAVVSPLLEKAGINAKPLLNQKWSRFISKLGKELGFDKIVDIRKKYRNGEYINKDYGWNYQFAALADGINPINIKHTFVMSINPNDFWTKSFGDSWQSCNTIDKTNKRGGTNNHQGCYSGETTSDILDESAFVVYYVDEEKKGDKPYEFCDKLKRCMFYIGEDKLIQGRVYPDGRDGGDAGLAKTMREIVQSVIAGLLDTPNLWDNKKGISECRSVMNLDGVGYYDINNGADDCNVSYLRRINGKLNHKLIQIGRRPIICPSCGGYTYDNDWIICDGCREGSDCCEYCGRYFNSDEEGVYCEDNGCYYCCIDCAENDGVHYCEDSEYYHTEDNCRQDEGSGYWYYYTDDGVWVGDYWYHSEESAEEAGARYCEDTEEWSLDWYETEDGYYVYDKDNCELLTVDDYVYWYDNNFEGDCTEDTGRAVEDVYQAEIDGLVWKDALTKRIYSMNTPYYEAESGDRYLSVAGARIAGEAVPLDNVIIVRSLINPAMEMEGGAR